jgi:ribonuclease Z
MRSFEVTILGSGAALPTANRNPTAQFVKCKNRYILIDCGEGTQVQLRKFKCKLQQIDHILISHLHGDHFFGLVGLLSTMNLLGRSQSVNIYGPEALHKIISNQLEVGGARLEFEINFHPLLGNETKLLFEDKCIEIHTFPLKHRIETNGFLIKEKKMPPSLLGEVFKEDKVPLAAIPFFKRFENFTDDNGKIHEFENYIAASIAPKSYAYCSDTSFLPSIAESCKGATVMYHEATFTEIHKDKAKKTNHSTAIDAAKIGVLCNVKTLFLGHFSARYNDTIIHLEEAKTVFKNVFAVEDGDVIQI